MTIHNWDAFRRSIWDWAGLRPCFPRGIEPTDLDGFVEINGRFLVLEGKGPGVPLKEGQRKTFERLFRLNRTIEGVFTVIVIWGDAEACRVDRLQFWPSAPIEADWAQFLAYVRAWAENAAGSTPVASPLRVVNPQTVSTDELRARRRFNVRQMSVEQLLANVDFLKSEPLCDDDRMWLEVLEDEIGRREQVLR